MEVGSAPRGHQCVQADNDRESGCPGAGGESGVRRVAAEQSGDVPIATVLNRVRHLVCISRFNAQRSKVPLRCVEGLFF